MIEYWAEGTWKGHPNAGLVLHNMSSSPFLNILMGGRSTLFCMVCCELLHLSARNFHPLSTNFSPPSSLALCWEKLFDFFLLCCHFLDTSLKSDNFVGNPLWRLFRGKNKSSFLAWETAYMLLYVWLSILELAAKEDWRPIMSSNLLSKRGRCLLETRSGPWFRLVRKVEVIWGESCEERDAD